MPNSLVNVGAISASGGPLQSGAEPDLMQVSVAGEDEFGRPVIKTPEGYDSIEQFMEEVRYEFQQDVDYDQDNRFAALDDLNFVGMDQWDPRVRASRIQQGRPCATRNVLPTYIGQVVAERRANRTAIKLLPRDNATADLAEIRGGLIKNIELNSRAERVYDAGCEDQVTCGIGNWRVAMEYAANDVFEQDIFIRQIPNPLAVVWDRMSVDPTGRDAGHCFVQDTMPRRQYEKTWPDSPPPSQLGDGILYANTLQGAWFSNDTVRVTEYWKMKSRKRTLALYQDGGTHDVTDLDPSEYSDKLLRDANGKPRVRRVWVDYAQMYLVTGWTILEGPYNLPISRLPIIRVMGREVRVGDDRVRFGLVRFAKDDQRFMNWLYSTAIETIALSPKAQWYAPSDAVEGREQAWRTAHVSGDPLLIFNKGASAPPTRAEPPPFPVGLVNMMTLANQGIKDTTGIQNAALGIQGNEVSGAAIDARKMESDQATIIYHDNVNAAIQETGTVVNELIPLCYDSTRIIRVIGADEKPKLMRINDPNDPNSPDLTAGKYDVVVDTGPSFATQRAESADLMMKVLQTNPAMMQVIGDIVFKSLDTPGAAAIAERLSKVIPMNLLSAQEVLARQNDESETMEAVTSTQQGQQQMEKQQQQQQLEERMANAKVMEAEANAAEAVGLAGQAAAQARIAEAQAGVAPAAAATEVAANVQEARHNAMEFGQNMANHEHTRLMDHANVEIKRGAAKAKVKPPRPRSKPSGK